MTAPIRATGLSRHFGQIVAVDAIDLEVEQGEIFGFLGPNGAGKSTTVRMLTTLLAPTAGRATVAGYDIVTEAGQVRRSIGVALQDAAIDPLMTGRELLRLQATLHDIPRRQVAPKSDDLLERVGLTAAADRRVGTYSGGMRRRLDLALSLVHEPDVLFLDEPTTGLDPMSRISLWEEVRKLNASGATVLLTTQYLEEADQLADRVAIIDRGAIVERGTPSDLKAAIGAPTLQIDVDEADQDSARRAVAGLGEERPDRGHGICIGLPQGASQGASQMASVIRALDDAGIVVHDIELHEPTLDDVFAEATGRRLEGARDDAA